MSEVTTRLEFPFVMQAHPAASDAGLWAQQHRQEIERRLLVHGAIQFRGLPIRQPTSFERFARAISTDFSNYDEESSPRHSVSGSVQTSTDYPAGYPIQFHNEYSYAAEWPMRIYFYCERPATRGGETLIADSRRVLLNIRREIVERFRRSKIMYRRNYFPGMGVSWQKAFGTSDPDQVARRCTELGSRAVWTNDGLTTTRIGEAIARHPKTGEEVWFNHGFFFNVRALEPEVLREAALMQPEEELLSNTYYGDGRPIEAHVIEELRAAYRAEAAAPQWESGDVLLLDNMLASHARSPFEGPRRVLALMADKCRRSELA